MAVRNHEVDDVDFYGDSGYWPSDVFDDLPEIISVRFVVEGDAIRGRVVKDVDRKSRTKIVFMAKSWRGSKPTNGQELRVKVVHETKAEDPRRGVLFVERIFPTIAGRDIGGTHGRCPCCRKWDVALYDYRPLPLERSLDGSLIKMQRAIRRSLSTCTACDAECEIHFS